MAISMYKKYEQDDREAAHFAYAASDGFTAIVSEAAGRGYRKATIHEINASAERTPFAEDLFCWRGGLWVRATST